MGDIARHSHATDAQFKILLNFQIAFVTPARAVDRVRSFPLPAIRTWRDANAVIALKSRAVNTSKFLRTSTPCYGQIVRLQHVVLPVKVEGQTRLLLQQERSDQLVRLGRVHGAAVDRQTVITTDEFVVDNLPIAIGVLHEGRRIAVCAVPRNARGIGQLRASFTHRLRKAVDALLAVHEGGTDAGASRIGDGRIGRAADRDDSARVRRSDLLVVGVVS